MVGVAECRGGCWSVVTQGRVRRVWGVEEGGCHAGDETWDVREGGREREREVRQREVERGRGR